MELHFIITLFLGFLVQLEGTPTYRIDETRTATGTRIYYKIDKSFRPEEKSYIIDRMKDIQSKTCLVWKELKAERPEARKWVEFERVEEPHSCATLQRPKNATQIYLAPHCFQEKWVIHEMLHNLGFEHEHKRRDRNCYVKVHSSKQSDHDYVIDEKADVSFPYDIKSVMHYRRGPYLRPADNYPDQDATFGSLDVLSELDVSKLNYLFCNGHHYCLKNQQECKRTNQTIINKKCMK